MSRGELSGRQYVQDNVSKGTVWIITLHTPSLRCADLRALGFLPFQTSGSATDRGRPPISGFAEL